MANNNKDKVLNFSSEREQSQACLNSAEREKNQGTKFLNAPPLRFPEFSGEWMKTTFGEIGKGFDYGMNAPAKAFDGCHKYIRITDIDEKQGIYLDSDVVSPDGNLSENYAVKENDILLARTGASTGKSYLYNKKDGRLYFAGFLIRVNIDNGNSKFIYTQLHTTRYYKWVKIMSARSGQPGINSQEYSSFPIYLPNGDEQNKIATLISLLDERIATQIGLIEDLKKLKSAISHKLFGRIPIRKMRLDTFFSKGKAGGTPRSTVKAYYDGNIPFLSINDMSLQGKYVYRTEKSINETGLKNSSAWIVPPFSLIMSMYASVGLVAINTNEMATSQAMFAMVLKDKSQLDYLYYYLCYFKDRHLHKLLETGTQSNINADVVRGIMIPDYGEEQNRFAATTLNTIDSKISNETTILDNMTLQKQYLLRNMFI